MNYKKNLSTICKYVHDIKEGDCPSNFKIWEEIELLVIPYNCAEGKTNRVCSAHIPIIIYTKKN